MRKKIALLAVLSVFTFIGCGSGQSALQQSEMVETKEINFSVPDGLPAIANAKNIKENPEIKDGYKVNYTIEKNSESLVTSVMKGEPDVVIVPSNVASTVYNKQSRHAHPLTERHLQDLSETDRGALAFPDSIEASGKYLQPIGTLRDQRSCAEADRSFYRTPPRHRRFLHHISRRDEQAVFGCHTFRSLQAYSENSTPLVSCFSYRT